MKPTDFTIFSILWYLKHLLSNPLSKFYDQQVFKHLKWCDYLGYSLKVRRKYGKEITTHLTKEVADQN